MKGLTVKEEELMGYFWEKGPLFVKEMWLSMRNRSLISIRYLQLFAGLKIRDF